MHMQSVGGLEQKMLSSAWIIQCRHLCTYYFRIHRGNYKKYAPPELSSGVHIFCALLTFSFRDLLICSCHNKAPPMVSMIP